MSPLLSSNLAPRHFIILLLYLVTVALVWAFTSTKYCMFHYMYSHERSRIIPILRIFVRDYKRVLVVMLLCAIAFFAIYEIYVHWHSVWNVIRKIGYHGEKSMSTLILTVPIFLGCISLYVIPCRIVEIIKNGIDEGIEYGGFVVADIICLILTWLFYLGYKPEKDYELMPYFTPYIFYVTAVAGVLVLFFVLIHFVIGKIVVWRKSKKV